MKPAKKAPERSFEPSLCVIKESPECWLIREAFIKKDVWVSDLHSLYCPSSKKAKQVFKRFQQFRHTGYSPHMFKTGDVSLSELACKEK